MINNIITIFFAILTLTSCVTLLDDAGNPGSFSPKPLFLRDIPKTEDSYSQGFRDGCYNFIGQNGFGYMRFYDRPISADSTLLYDPLYQRGYKHGDRHCGTYVNRGTIL